MRYPNDQPATDILIATVALPGPNIPATTVGSVVKKEPFATPFNVAKMIRGPKVFETGHIASIETAFTIMKNRNMLTGPILSHNGPAIKRPIALLALNPATSAAPVLELRPMD